MRQHVWSSGHLIESCVPQRFSEVWMSSDLALLNSIDIPDQSSLCFKKATCNKAWRLFRLHANSYLTLSTKSSMIVECVLVLILLPALLNTAQKYFPWLAQHWSRAPMVIIITISLLIGHSRPKSSPLIGRYHQKSTSCHNPKSVINCYKWVMSLFDIYF